MIGRVFTATELNTKYVGDITYLALEGGKFLYPATIIDLASRRLGDRRSHAHRARHRHSGGRRDSRGSLAEAVMHSDHGTQYTSRAFADACRTAGVHQSMSAVGSSADNALAESFNATFKRETPQGRRIWSNEREGRLDAFRGLNRYKDRRRHPSLGQRSRTAYETASTTTSITLSPAA
ncbi:DDE-type integrase/transposase/recombinase [Streptomyces sp. NBC_01497]|uniref:DDE-type integrase/transposase/recombinase n=1 Tax=Streptomyces sp. NBC_01497 TaxID=2903885 RepID=UPI002E376C6A|nr:DDE-type integrase/transposase/recombinase [Streptomyces sp. NBC_01497]